MSSEDPFELLRSLPREVLIALLERDDICLKAFRKNIILSSEKKYNDEVKIAALTRDCNINKNDYDKLLKELDDDTLYEENDILQMYEYKYLAKNNTQETKSFLDKPIPRNVLLGLGIAICFIGISNQLKLITFFIIFTIFYVGAGIKNLINEKINQSSVDEKYIPN